MEGGSLNQKEWGTFTSEYAVISKGDPEMKYRLLDDGRSAVQWGQRKLALAIVQFLSEHWDNQVVPNPTLLYIGASPGTNIAYIMTNHFPDFTVHLYDSRPMKVTPTDKMVVHQELFTDDIAKQWSGRNDIFLVSDIRSVDSYSNDPDTREEGIWADMLLQARVYGAVRPVRAQLKFRLPYYGEGIGKTRYHEYLNGLVYRGIYTRPTSTETRLVPMENSDGVSMILWDIKKYESQMFYHNVEIRQYQQFRNPLVDEDDPLAEKPVDGNELTNDYDSIAESFVWSNYLQKVGGEGMVTLDNVRGLSRSLTQFLAEGRSSEKMTTLAKLRADPLFIKRKFK